ncbi:MAG: pyridoxal-dependent decarboxylase [Fulvivirga sp.]
MKLENNFIVPLSKNKKYHKKTFRKIVDQVVDEMSKQFGGEIIPEPFLDIENFVGDLNDSQCFENATKKLKIVYRYSTKTSHKFYLGQMDSVPTVGSMMAELITSAVNNNMLSNEMSPFLTDLETSLLLRIQKRFGLGLNASGIMTNGGTLANIQALTIARNVKLENKPIYSLNLPPVIFASEHCHTSIDKAAMILGIGHEFVVKVNSQMGVMCIKDLERKINSYSAKSIPIAVVSTYGSTNSGSLDPIDEIQYLCDKYKIWHHVDAVYGGALAFTDHKLPDFSKVHSLSFNPQKWLFVAKTSSILFLNNKDYYISHFKTSLPYISQSSKTNIGEISLQGSRSGTALKLWLSLYLIGINGYMEIIKSNLKIAKDFYSYLANHSNLKGYTKPDLNIVLFRSSKEGSFGVEITEYIQKHLNSNSIYVSSINWEGDLWLKAVFLNPFFDNDSLKELENKIEECLFIMHDKGKTP